MDSKELRRLCERVMKTGMLDDYDSVHDDLATNCLRLLDENDAMRGALEWYADLNNWESFIGGVPFAWQDNGSKANSVITKLGERT